MTKENITHHRRARQGKGEETDKGDHVEWKILGGGSQVTGAEGEEYAALSLLGVSGIMFKAYFRICFVYKCAYYKTLNLLSRVYLNDVCHRRQSNGYPLDFASV